MEPALARGGSASTAAPTRRRLDRPLASIFVMCRDYYLANANRKPVRKGGEPYKAVKKALTQSLRAMAELHAVNYAGYNADRDHPGYLIKVDPPMLFRVPYHVLPTFPTGEDLEDLWSLSRTVSSSDRSVISLSGSNVLRKIFELVGDVDFCEYFPFDDTETFSRMASNLDGTPSVVCVGFAFNGRKWQIPWADGRPTKSILANEVNSADISKATMKADYIGKLGNGGVTDISNVIIILDEEGRSAGLSRTFAAQEAPLVPIDWLPNQMNDPVEMGRYIDWLANAIYDLSKKGDMRKCLKRCASLARVLFSSDISDDIAELSSQGTVLLSHKLSEVDNLLARLSKLAEVRVQNMLTLLQQQKSQLSTKLAALGGPPEAAIIGEFNAEVDDIANRLLDQVLFIRASGAKVTA